MDVNPFTHQTGHEAADPGHVSLAVVFKPGCGVEEAQTSRAEQAVSA